MSTMYKCDKCNKEVLVVKGKLENGVQLVFDTSDKKTSVIRCNECYAEDKSLTNYQPCEVYSRIVGYLRPVNQWHDGKQQEFKDRKVYKI